MARPKLTADAVLDSPEVAELATLEAEMHALSDRLHAFRTRHPPRCRCVLCVHVRGTYPGFPTALDCLDAAAAALTAFAGEVGSVRPLTRAESDEVVRGLRARTAEHG